MFMHASLSEVLQLYHNTLIYLVKALLSVIQLHYIIISVHDLDSQSTLSVTRPEQRQVNGGHSLGFSANAQHVCQQPAATDIIQHNL